MEADQETINDLGKAVTDLVVKYGIERGLPPYEIANQLIGQAVSMLMCTAPDHVVAVKTIFGCLHNGIEDYQECHCEE